LGAAQQSPWSVMRSRKVSDPTAAFRKLGATGAGHDATRWPGSAFYLLDAQNLRHGLAALEDCSGNSDNTGGTVKIRS
jgi:hypothetical protein